MASLFSRCDFSGCSALPVMCLPVPGKKINILMYVVPLMVPILGSAKHIRNFVRSHA